MSEHRRDFPRGQLVRVQRQRLRVGRFAEPLHVVLHKDLNNVAAKRHPPLQGLPHPTARRHMRATFHSAYSRRVGDARYVKEHGEMITPPTLCTQNVLILYSFSNS